MNTLVLGASGFLGMNLVNVLRERDVTPVCAHRGRVPRMALRRADVPTIPGDIDNRESLVAALRGIDLVYHFAAHYPATSLDRNATMQRGLGQLDNVLAACASTGVQRLVFVSSVATVRQAQGPSTEADVFEASPGFGVYHDLKWYMEQRVLREERFQTSILCPGACLGPLDVRIGTSMMLVATARGEHVPHPEGWVNITDARDVAEVAARVGELDEMPPRLLISGSDHRLHTLLTTLAERYDTPPPPAPLAAAAAVALADAEEQRAAAQGERPTVSRELVDLTIHGVRVDASLARRLTGVTYRTLDDTLDAFDAWARSKHIIPNNTKPVRSANGRR